MFTLIYNVKIFISICVSVCGCVHMNAVPEEARKLNPLELVSQAVVSCLICLTQAQNL